MWLPQSVRRELEQETRTDLLKLNVLQKKLRIKRFGSWILSYVYVYVSLNLENNAEALLFLFFYCIKTPTPTEKSKV